MTTPPTPSEACGCKTDAQTGTENGYTCPWHRERYLAALADAEARGRAAQREEDARAICERCRTTPDLPALACEAHPGMWCHESGVHGWGHYACNAATLRAGAPTTVANLADRIESAIREAARGDVEGAVGRCVAAMRKVLAGGGA